MEQAPIPKDELDIPELTREQLGKGVRGRYVIERGATSFGAYVPDLPGCVAAAKSRDEVVTLIEEAIELHVSDLEQDNAT